MADVTVAPTVELGATPPRVRLIVTDANLPARTSANVVRNNPDGTTSPVRTVSGGPLELVTVGAVREGTVYDYEAPYGLPVSYTTIESPGAESVEVVVGETRPWLIHPGVPELSVPVELRAGSLAEESYPVAQAIFYPMGRETPIVHTDGSRKAAQSSAAFSTETLEDLRRLVTLLNDSSPLLFNVPDSLGLGVPARYIAVGQVEVTRPSDIGSDPQRVVAVPFHVVERPIGGTQAERTLLDLLAFPTLADLAAAYPTLAAVLAGP